MITIASADFMIVNPSMNICHVSQALSKDVCEMCANAGTFIHTEEEMANPMFRKLNKEIKILHELVQTM